MFLISGKCTFVYDFYHHLTIREGLALLRDTFPCPRFSKEENALKFYTIYVVTLFLHKNLPLGLNRLSNIVFKFSWNLAQTVVKFWKSTFTILPFFPSLGSKGIILNKNKLEYLLHKNTLGHVCLKMTQSPWKRYQKCEILSSDRLTNGQ